MNIRIYFNSTMVRLKAEGQEYFGIRLDTFQFHYGTIKSFVMLHLTNCVTLISIPLWYD